MGEGGEVGEGGIGVPGGGGGGLGPKSILIKANHSSFSLKREDVALPTMLHRDTWLSRNVEGLVKPAQASSASQAVMHCLRVPGTSPFQTELML